MRLRDASVTISSSTFSENNYGIYSNRSDISLIIDSSTFSDNIQGSTYFTQGLISASFTNITTTGSGPATGFNINGPITSEVHLGGNNGAVYLLGQVIVNAGATLTVDPGAIIKGSSEASVLHVLGDQVN